MIIKNVEELPGHLDTLQIFSDSSNSERMLEIITCKHRTISNLISLTLANIRQVLWVTINFNLFHYYELKTKLTLELRPVIQWVFFTSFKESV